MQRKITHSLKLIADALEEYQDRVGVACSFGKDSLVTLHLCLRIDPTIKIFSIMTPYKFRETLAHKEHITKLWLLNNIYTFQAPIAEGGALYLEDVEKCCDYYKVQQTKRAIKELGLDAWICGLRNTEGHTRKFLNEVEEKDGITKVNPILQWTEAEVWLYHTLYGLPANPLYGQGYRSLGCQPCSQPYGEEERSGRWQGTSKCGGECGIHSKSLKE